MSAENKTKFEVMEILIAVMKEGIAAQGIPNTNFVFMESDQTLPTAKKDFVLLKLNSTARTGWPKVTNERDAIGPYRRERFFEQQEWEIRIVKRLPATAVKAYVSEDDVSNALKTWFNGLGNLSMRKRGISNLFAKDSREEKGKDDSALNVKPGTFSLPVIVHKTVIYRHNVADILKPDVKPI